MSLSKLSTQQLFKLDVQALTELAQHETREYDDDELPLESASPEAIDSKETCKEPAKNSWTDVGWRRDPIVAAAFRNSLPTTTADYT